MPCLSQGAVLLEAAAAQDRLATLRTRDRAAVSPREDASLQRLEVAWSKALAGLLAQLRIQR